MQPGKACYLPCRKNIERLFPAISSLQGMHAHTVLLVLRWLWRRYSGIRYIPYFIVKQLNFRKLILVVNESNDMCCLEAGIHSILTRLLSDRQHYLIRNLLPKSREVALLRCCIS